MRKKAKQLVALALAGMMLLLCGCGGGGTTVSSTEYDFEVTMAPGYPIDNTQEIEWWVPINVGVTTKYGNLTDTPFAAMLKENTGANIKFIHPPTGQEASQFNIVVSSGQLPDIMSYSWGNYANGGSAGAVRDNLILPINKILEKGGAPALKALLDSNPVWKDSVYTDEGWLPGFPSVGALSQVVYSGPMIRKDLLDKAGLGIPETIAEIETALYAFKEQGIKIPLEVELGKHMVAGNAVVGGFGIGASYYVDNGKVKYGPAQPEFKEFLATMNKWFNDGLYDREFSTLQGSGRMTSELLAGNIGLAFGANGGNWGKYLPALEETRPDVKFVTMPFPTTEKGKKPEFGHMENRAGGAYTAITTGCDNIELAAKLLDYAYTEEGHLATNYGKKGRDWEYDADGIVRFTDAFTNQNSEMNGGQSVSDMMGQHTASGSVAFGRVQDEGILNVLFSREDQKENVRIWTQTNMAEHQFPNVQYTTEEAQEIASLKTAIETHMHEMMYKFIAGTESLDKWDTYLANYETIGLSRALEIMQAAYDRYVARTK
ncbi:MAG: extracellular solute-binding protein [Ruminococcaceae bacterium]|nr:extracellular solute-binding protein [Oscillospiraceae bacterium]